MSPGVLGEYAKSLFASSPCTHKSFPRILRICLNSFRAYGDDFVYSLSTIPGDFKGTVFQKNRVGVYLLA